MHMIPYLITCYDNSLILVYVSIVGMSNVFNLIIECAKIMPKLLSNLMIEDIKIMPKPILTAKIKLKSK